MMIPMGFRMRQKEEDKARWSEREKRKMTEMTNRAKARVRIHAVTGVGLRSA